MNRPVSLVPPSLTEGPDGPRFLGPYLLDERIGSGGTAVVYKARRRGAAGFEKQVVVKTILPELAGDPRFIELFTEEAKLSAQLFHANIVQVQDFGVLRNTPFLELELLSGWNVKQVFDELCARGKKLPVGVTVHVMTEACRGLAYAHAFVDGKGALRPIIHRDISPSNIMLCRDGAVKLLDFGLASLTRGETLSIETFRGKLAYMSPEQLERQQLDRTADVFAMGIVLHELLTGRRLFAADTDAETVQRLQAFAVKPPSKLNDAVPKALDAIVMKALARDPRDRYQSAVELLRALEGVRKVATRGELLACLGGVASDVYATTCDGCGVSVPQGSECFACCTVVGAMEPDMSGPLAVATPPRHLFVVRTPPNGIPVVAGFAPARARLAVLLAAALTFVRTHAARARLGVVAHGRLASDVVRRKARILAMRCEAAFDHGREARAAALEALRARMRRR
jgi:hypothetical protein